MAKPVDRHLEHFFEDSHKRGRLSSEELKHAIEKETQLFKGYYTWLEQHMPLPFFEEFKHNHLMTIAHSLVGFELQNSFTIIHFSNCSIALCLNSPDSDLKILNHFRGYGIQNYRTYNSDEPLPYVSTRQKLRVAIIHYSDLKQQKTGEKPLLDEREKKALFEGLRVRDPSIHREEFESLIRQFNPLFLQSMPKERLILALDMARHALTRDHIKYEVRYHQDWKDDPTGKLPSMQIVFAWRQAQQYNFFYKLAKCFYRHHLVMKRSNAAYLNPYTENSTLVMSIALHGMNDLAAWEATDIKEFLRELATLKFFDEKDRFDQAFVETNLLSGNLCHFLKSAATFIHQFLLHDDPNLYSYDHIIEALTRHSELTIQLCQAFEKKFHPENHDLKAFEKIREEFLLAVQSIDTGSTSVDHRRKTILQTAMLFVHYTLKTNFYRMSKIGFGFRLDPKYLESAPYSFKKKFPETPFAIFFIQSKSVFGFHIRFKDLSRGGIRTVYPREKERALYERPNIFLECYNLAYTQQKKNKDIPEGGSKGVIFIASFDELEYEAHAFSRELEHAGFDEKSIRTRITEYKRAQRQAILYQSQRMFIYTLLSLVNCYDDGSLKTRDIIDYYGKPEYLYLGPDENMHNCMIEWIAEHAKTVGYQPKSAFISSKPKCGINHKEYGVTSYGVNVYMHELLKYLGISPTRDTFTVKMTGGPDGDVAGNQIHNLYRFYPQTAKLLALTDGNGTIYSPLGLDLSILNQLFLEGKSICHYPPEHLSEGGFLLDLTRKRQIDTYTTQTTCWRMHANGLKEEFLSGNEASHLFRSNIHQCLADIFIPAGGRPRTLNEESICTFLDASGQPTSKAIIEGANLYLTPEARKVLEKKGVLIIKDSSANKGGVICSSLEVLAGLTMTEEEFLQNKPRIVEDILEMIKMMALKEARVLIEAHAENKTSLIDSSDRVSSKINSYTYRILDGLESTQLSTQPKDPLNLCLLAYCPKIIREQFADRVIHQIPDIHKKAIIACFIASHIVYEQGLQWSPSITDVLPIIIQQILASKE